MTPKVLNKHKDIIGPDDVYIGRPAEYGNPYVIGKHGTRDEVIDKYIEIMSCDEVFLENVRRDLKGKNLVCFCAPKRCHGDWLLKIANE